MQEEQEKIGTGIEGALPIYGGASDSGIDLAWLKDNLLKSPWERMQANDDALNYAESLRSAMLKRKLKINVATPSYP